MMVHEYWALKQRGRCWMILVSRSQGLGDLGHPPEPLSVESFLISPFGLEDSTSPWIKGHLFLYMKVPYIKVD